MAGPMSWITRPALLRSLVLRARLAARLLREPAVPWLVKSVALLPLVYVLVPIDLLPDVIPLLGQLDDLGVVIALTEAFLALCPGAAVDFHRQALEAGQRFAPMRRGGGGDGSGSSQGEVIDTEWRRG
jgi:uncharacterized membrane protein YkvA (DUF1232 family)